MNERIRELAEQAGFEITPWGGESLPCVHQEGPIVVELEKFAQLIVQECANQATWAQDTNAKDIGGEVLKHFGGKE